MTTVLATAGFLTSQVLEKAASSATTLQPVQSVSGSAYGESVDVTLLSLAHVTSPKTPTEVVLAPDGKSSTPPSSSTAPEQELGVSVGGTVLNAGVLSVYTQGVFGPAPSNALLGSTSSATVANVNVLTGADPLKPKTPLIHADAVTSSCTSNSAGSTGSTSIVNLQIDGTSILSGAVPANTDIPIIVGTLHLNEQLPKPPSKSTITVNAIDVELAKPFGSGHIIISQSHCDVTAAPQFAVSVGYGDNYNGQPPGFFPTSPWPPAGGVFVGSPATTGADPTKACVIAHACWDTGVVRVDNTSTSPETIHVSVTVGSRTYDLWGNQSVPAGQSLTVAQTGDYNFDVSDQEPSTCVNSGDIPVVHVTVNGFTQDFHDTGQVLDTGGVDKSMCPFDTNEGTPYAHLTS